MRLGTGGPIAAILLAVIAGGTVAGGASSPDLGSTVEIRVFQFTPSPLAVNPGTAVTWVNRDDIEHTVTAGLPDQPTGRFDLRLATPGASVRATFNEPGVYRYFCARHRSMRGEIRVTDPH